MRLSHIVFIISTVSLFGALWVMFLQIAPRDGFSWGLAIFSFMFMLLSGVTSTVKEKER